MGYIVAISLVAIALLPQGVSTVDFSGTWRIDLQKSLYPGDGLESIDALTRFDIFAVAIISSSVAAAARATTTVDSVPVTTWLSGTT